MSQANALAELTPKIGTETRVSDWLTITQEMIDQFADATLDQQWIHTDPERAKQESPYKTTIAHGFFTLSLVPYMSGSVDPDTPRMPGVKLSVNLVNQMTMEIDGVEKPACVAETVSRLYFDA